MRRRISSGIPLSADRSLSLPTMLLIAGCGIAIAIAVIVIGPASAKEARASTATAQRGTVQQTVSGSGSLEAGSQADLNFQGSGTIEHVYVQEGQSVAKGELLAILDDGDAQDSLDQAEANLSSAQAGLDSAEAGSTTTSASSGANPSASAQTVALRQGSHTGTSTRGKTGKGGGSGGSNSSGNSASTQTQTQSREAKQASVASARANLESAEISVAQAQQDLADTKLRAPMSGLVTSISGAAGESVGGGGTSTSGSSGATTTASTGGAGGGSGGASTTSGTPTSSSTSSTSTNTSSAFITVANLDQMKVSIDLSEADIADVKVGQAATVTVNALDDQEFAAHILAIGLTSSDSSGVVTYPVTLLLDQGAKELKPGMTGSAEVVVAQADGTISIPSSALTGTSVTVQEADGKTTVKQVTTGLVGESNTQILTGLQAGDKVVLQTQAAAGGNGMSGFPGGGPPGGGGLGGGAAPPGGGGP